MYRVFLAAVILSLSTLGLLAQASGQQPDRSTKKTLGSPLAESPLDIAKAAINAHGGDNLKNMTSLFVRGTVDVTGAFSYVIPATFMMVISGDKYAFELNNPFQPLRQIFDGKSMHSSGYELPPATSLGCPLLTKAGSDGSTISVLGSQKKKRKGFRITTREGFYTDFIVDDKTKQIKSYESSYDIDGRTVTTSVEIDEFETVKGIVVPKRYSQRFDLGQMTVYANFKTKEILINTDIEDSVFALPK